MGGVEGAKGRGAREGRGEGGEAVVSEAELLEVPHGIPTAVGERGEAVVGDVKFLDAGEVQGGEGGKEVSGQGRTGEGRKGEGEEGNEGQGLVFEREDAKGGRERRHLASEHVRWVGQARCRGRVCA